MNSASQQYPSFSVVFRSSEDADHLNRFLLIFLLKLYCFNREISLLLFTCLIYISKLFFGLYSIDSLLRLTGRVFPIDKL